MPLSNSPQVPRALLAAKVDETFRPVDVSLLGAQAVMPNAQRFTHLIEQPRKSGGGCVQGERRSHVTRQGCLLRCTDGAVEFALGLDAMSSNLSRFKKDLEALLAQGQLLDYAMRRKASGAKEFDAQVKKQLGDKAEAFLKKLPSFEGEYQAWYSEAMAVIQQLLPHRLDDFKRHYEKPKTRKEITYENYHIEDFLQGLRVTRYGSEVVVDCAAAVPRFAQQLAILSAAEKRFDSSLFEIRQIVQADLFDSEIEAARELLKKKFARAAGAIAGVVLEKHLAQVCEDHGIRIPKKNPTISDFNELLKNSDVVDTAQWRFIQHLGDLRNLCDHNKKVEPTADQVGDLIDGVAKVMKTVL